VTFILGDVDCDIVDDDDHEELRRSGRVTRQDVDDKSSEASTDKDDKTSDDKTSDDKTSGTKSINNFTCVA